MYKTNYTILTNREELSYTGNPVRVDFYSGVTQNLHTVSATVSDFIGRIYIEATLNSDTNADEWFPIYLTSGTPYKQYPINSNNPTEINGGDSITEGFTFRANILYIRARVDRSYLNDTVYDPAVHGRVTKILLNI